LSLASDVGFANDGASLMMYGFATFYSKHHIIANEMNNIIFAEQMHHFGFSADTSL